jgi:hypothetical protein
MINELKCHSAEEIFLALKSSSFISHDLSQQRCVFVRQPCVIARQVSALQRCGEY